MERKTDPTPAVEASASSLRLAILGGEPTFPERLHVGRPNLGSRERFLERVGGIFDRNWLTNGGPLVREFEQRIADMIGVRHCIAMCNGTVALEIAIRALELKGEVLVPAFTFIATAHALQWQEITPVFCDIDPETYLIDPAHAESMITPRTTGIIGVHLWGRVADTLGLTEVARRHRLKLLFDASHAVGCTKGGRSVGGFGDAEVFSFHATKFVNAFEGGAVVTNDDELARRMRLMKNFGFVGDDNVGHIGTNGKMSEVSAAMGLTSLDSMDEFVERNRANYRSYRELTSELPGVELLEYDESERNNYQYIVFEIDEGSFGLSRDELMSALRSEGILARRYFYPGCHRMQPYRSLFPHAALLLPVTEAVAQRVILVPTGMAVDEEIVSRVCGVLRRAHEDASAIHEVLQRRAQP